MHPLPPDVERAALVGLHLYPASAKSRAACRPRLHLEATCDLDQLAAWAAEFPGCNWRVLCGPSRLFALDVDVPGPDHAGDGKATLARLIDRNGPLPERPMTRSGGGGWCLLFRHDGDDLSGSAHPAHPGLDPLRGNQSITVPPSAHLRTGAPYRWVVPVWELAPPPAPEWLLAIYRRPPPPPVPVWQERGLRPDDDRVAAKLSASCARVRVAQSGQRNNTLNREAYGIGRWVAAGLMDEAEALTRLYAAARDCGMEDKRVRNVIKYAWRAAARDPIRVEGRRAAA